MLFHDRAGKAKIPENRHFAVQPAPRSSKNQPYGADI